jgi:hypothetical protein
MTQVQIQLGYRFVLRHDVDRFPDFIASEGTTGTVTDVESDGTIIVLMDQHIDGAEKWDNHVWWENEFLNDTLPFNSVSA